MLAGAWRHCCALVARCGKCLCKRLPKLDKRFSKEDEAAYVQSLEHYFLFPAVLGALGTIFSYSYFAYEMYAELTLSSDDRPFIEGMVASRIFCVLAAVLLLIVFAVKRWTRCMHSISLEGFIIVWTMSLQIGFIFFSAWHGSHLFGVDPHIAFSDWDLDASDSVAVLGASVVTSVTCLVFPVRSHVSWMVPTTGLLSYLFLAFRFGVSAPSYVKSTTVVYVLGIMCTLYGSNKNEKYFRQEWLAQRKVGVQQDFMESQYEGVCRILNIVCDCIVPLGSDCQILEPEPRFAATLIRDAQSLLGTCILDYMPDEEDQDKFKAFVTCRKSEATTAAKNLEDKPSAGMLHVSLRDAYGKDFPVDIYYTQILRGEDIQYLVGIVESGAREPAPARGDLDFAFGQTQAGEFIGLRHTKHVPGSEEASSYGTGTSMPAELDVGVVSVDFLAKEGLPILNCTPGFQQLSGPLTEMQRLSDFIVNLHCLEPHIQSMVNVFCNSCQNVVLEGIVFGKANTNLQFEVKAFSLDFAKFTYDEESENGVEIVVRAELDGITPQKRHKRSRSRPKRSPRNVTL